MSVSDNNSSFSNQSLFSHKDFDPLAFIKANLMQQNIGTKKIDSKADEQVKFTNSMLFKMHIMESEANNTLQYCTKIIIEDVKGRLLSEKQTKLNEYFKPLHSDLKTHQMRDEFIQLHEVDKRITQCQSMSAEIEHFETRIAKVEEFIRHNRFLELVQLVQQIQESLKVVRDLSFFDKQKQRIERFDKTIMNYLQQKESELILDQSQFPLMRQNHEQIRALITLEKYFNRDQAFLEIFIDQKLMPQFLEHLNYQQVNISYAKFTTKFFTALSSFIQKEQSFILQIGSELQIWENFLVKVMLKNQDLKQRVFGEFTMNIQFETQVEFFNDICLSNVQLMREYLPKEISLDFNIYTFFKDLYQALTERYRKQLDSAVNEAFESIMENDQQYPLIANWTTRLDSITYTIEKILANNIEICMCYDLQSLTQSVIKQLEKFLMQICYHIGQFSNKKLHFGSHNPSLQGQTAVIDDQTLALYEQKFRWQGVFEYIIIHHVLCKFFQSIRDIDLQLNKSLQKIVSLFEKNENLQYKKLSAFMAQKNTSYFKLLQKLFSGSNAKQIIFDPSYSQNLEVKVFKQEVLEESIRNNMMRTFCMPIFKEINNINIFPMWKLQSLNSALPQKKLSEQDTFTQQLPAEASEYIRKIGEHFITFIHQLDQSHAAQITEQAQFYQPYNSVSEYWISQVGSFLLSTIQNKYLKITTFSSNAEKQIIVDILYMRKLISQFVQGAAFQIMDTLILAMVVSKKDGENKSLQEILEIASYRETLGNLFGTQQFDYFFNEMILKSIQSKRK